MTDRPARAHPPLTLIANSQEWHSRSLESILGPHGYAVLRAYTGKQAIERAQASRPDLIILDTDLPDRDGLDVCRELRADPSISDATPILITSPTHSSRQKRLDAMMRAKRAVDRAQEESLLDELTGLYNIRGLARRARELGSQSFRQKEPFACIVITPLLLNEQGAALSANRSAEIVEALAQVLKVTGRTSDAIGTVGPGEFAVIAQGTDSDGAVGLAERLTRAVSNMDSTKGIRVAVGYDAVPNYHDAPIEPSDMLMRASLAMRMSRTDAAGPNLLNIRKFEGQLN